MVLEALVIQLVIEAILSGIKPKYAGIAKQVEANPEYRGTRRGKSLEREIRRILAREEVLRQIRDNTSTNNITAGIKIGRLEIKGKIDLD